MCRAYVGFMMRTAENSLEGFGQGNLKICCMEGFRVDQRGQLTWSQGTAALGREAVAEAAWPE